MNAHKEVRLYNVIFPIWLLILFPLTWLIVIPANFLIDSLIVYFGLKRQHVDAKGIYKKVILKVVCFGFLADCVGGFFMFLPNLIDYSLFTENTTWIYNNLVNPIMYNPFQSIYALLWVIIAMVISSIMIYLLNYRFSFTKVNLDIKIKKKISLTLAILTTPLLFLLPTAWFY